MKKPILILALAALFLPGCLTRNLSESGSVLEIDKEEIFGVSDFFLEENDSTAVLRITSNRSWSAHLNDLDNPIDESDPSQSVSWAYLSVEDHPNLTNSTDVVDIVVTFRRNYSKTPNNGVLNIYSEGSLKKTVSLRQDGVKYYLNASCGVLEPSDEGEEVYVNVSCNHEWKAQILDGASADAVLKTTEGVDHATLKLKFLENEEKVQKSLTLRITSEECDPVDLNFVQSESRSDIPVLEAVFKIVSNGKASHELQPRLVPDKSINLATSEEVPGVKYYYATSDVSFDDIATPTEKSDEVPEEGIQLIIESTSSSQYYKISPHGRKYIKILALADGYRKSYEQILVRNWQFGIKYDNIDGTLGQVSGTVYNFPVEYYGLNFKSKAASNKDWAARISVQVGNDITLSPEFGTRGGMYVKGNSTNGADVTFFIGETQIGNGTITCKSSAPQTVSSEAGELSNGDLFKMQIAKNALQIWNLAVFEQKKIRP